MCASAQTRCLLRRILLALVAVPCVRVSVFTRNAHLSYDTIRRSLLAEWFQWFNIFANLRWLEY